MFDKLLLNIIKREVALVLSTYGKPTMGIVDSYDPTTYSATVRLQPEDQDNPEKSLTGFLPVGTLWIGNGWGLFCPPTAGDVVDVHFQENDPNAGFIMTRHFGDVLNPLGVNSGEFWLVHKSGTCIKLTNDGNLLMDAAANLNITVNGSTNITSTGNVTITAPALYVNGEIQATGDIIDHVTTKNQSMAQQRAIYDSHTHPGVQPGGGTTGTPNQTE